MSPIMEYDGDWSGVQASTPIFKKGDYQLSITKVRGQAWAQQKDGVATGQITQVIKLRPKMVGVYDSNGKLSGEQDKKTIKDVSCEEINLWVHSDGGRKMAKQQMMSVAGFNPNDETDEKAFNEMLKKQKLDLGFKVIEKDDGGYDLEIGDGWETLLVGKNVRANMDEETREVAGRDPVRSQNYVRLSPVNL